MDKCLFARYSTQGRITSDPTYAEDRKHRGRGQLLLEQLSQDLGPAAPLRPAEVAVTLKMPKRRLQPPKMRRPIAPTILVEDFGEGKADQITIPQPEREASKSSSADSEDDYLDEAAKRAKEKKFAGTRLNEKKLGILVRHRMQSLNVSGDPSRYKALDSISPNAKKILIKRGGRLVRFFDQRLVEQSKEEEEMKKKDLHTMEQLPVLQFNTLEGHQILYSDKSIKRLHQNDTTRYDPKSRIQMDYREVGNRATYMINNKFRY